MKTILDNEGVHCYRRVVKGNILHARCFAIFISRVVVKKVCIFTVFREIRSFSLFIYREMAILFRVPSCRYTPPPYTCSQTDSYKINLNDKM